MRLGITRLVNMLTAVCAVMILSVQHAQAAYYADLSFEYHTVNLVGQDLNPYTVRLKAGVPIARGFGIEASYAAPMNDDSINQLNLDIEQQATLHIRYQSSESYNGVTLYLLLGQSWTTISTSGANAIPDEDFEDLSWGIGAEDYSRSVKNLFYSFQYTRYYEDNDLTLSGISLGLRYNF